MPLFDTRFLIQGSAVAMFAVTAVTLATYGLREVVPVLSTGVMYPLAFCRPAGSRRGFRELTRGSIER